MAVIFWAVGGVVVAAATHGDHSAHSDYDNYGNYSNYSDAAERQRKRREGMMPDIESSARELSTYKRGVVNPQLNSQYLKEAKAMTVDADVLDSDVKSKINTQINIEELSQTEDLRRELEEIDGLLAKISRIESENR